MTKQESQRAIQRFMERTLSLVHQHTHTHIQAKIILNILSIPFECCKTGKGIVANCWLCTMHTCTHTQTGVMWQIYSTNNFLFCLFGFRAKFTLALAPLPYARLAHTFSLPHFKMVNYHTLRFYIFIHFHIEKEKTQWHDDKTKFHTNWNGNINKMVKIVV